MALFGKQLWKMAQYPDSLMAKVFKGKYFPQKSPLAAKLGPIPSFAWRSIFEATYLMKMKMKKEFGNGAIICVTQDPSLPVIPPRPLVVNLEEESSSITMNMLRGEGSDEWNMNVLRHMFEEEDVSFIVQVRPGEKDAKELYSWSFNADGQYTVKSGYWVWLHRIKQVEQLGVASEPSLSSLFKAAWGRTRSQIYKISYGEPSLIAWLWQITWQRKILQGSMNA